MGALVAALTEVSDQNICLWFFESDERSCPRIVVGIVLLICVAANSDCLWISGPGAGWGRVRRYKSDSSQAVDSSSSCTQVATDPRREFAPGMVGIDTFGSFGGICPGCEMVSPDQDRTCAGGGLDRVRRHLPLPLEIRGNASCSTRVSFCCPHFDRSTGCGEAGVGLLVQARSSGSVGLGGSNSKRGRVGERTFCWAFLNERARP